jgi:hypothetical protein
MSSSGENRLPVASRLYIGQSRSSDAEAGRCRATTDATMTVESTAISSGFNKRRDIS